MGRTTQNELTDALTSAISAIADSSAQSKDATLTIEAEVVEVIDEGLGTYKVKYLGNQFEATTAHTEVTYSIGDMVYVVVPNGNFDKNKVILSPVTPSAVGYAATALTSQGSTYVDISDNLFQSVNDISMSTWKPIDANASRTLTNNNGFISLFNAALKDSRTFNFTCKIRTDIEKERRSRGDYGLELHLPVLQNINGQSTRKDFVVKLNVDNITGDPYNLQAFALQNLYFTLPDDMELYVWIPPEGQYHPTPAPEDIPWIGYFVKDFLGEDDTKPDDIFITDIKLLSTMEITEENMPGYNVVIKATNGNSFLTGRTGDEKTLSILTFLNGKQTKNDAFDCYWFKENVGIGRDSDKYHRLGGIGWEILNEVKETTYLEDGKPIYQYVTNNYTQKILQNDIHCDTVFKCVLAKDINTEKPIIKSAKITIKNLQNNATIELTTETGSTVFSRGIGDVVLHLKYYEDTITNVVQSNFNVGYYWQKIDKNGNVVEDFNYTVIELNKQIDGVYHTKIRCPVNDIEEVNIFKCTVYIEVNKQYLVTEQIVGTASLMISIGQYLNGHIEVINDDKVYKYDADGNSPMSDGQYSGALSDFITTIDPISIRLYKGDGTEFADDEYAVTTISWLVPINSLIALTSAQQQDTTSNPGYYTITGSYSTNNQLNYGIATTYNYNKTDDTIIIKASTPSTILKDTISEVARLTFLKDGEGGTNGTSYSAVITYDGYKYGENGHKFQLVYTADTSEWYIFDSGKKNNSYKLFDNPHFDIKCYLQGNQFYTYAVAWSIFDDGHEKNSTYTAATSPITVTGYNSDLQSHGRLALTGDNMTGPDDVFCAIIQAAVTCASSTQNAPTIIYAYYPIECIYLKYKSYLDNLIPYLDNGFSKVLYGSDGSNPRYDQKSSFVLTNYYDDDLSNYFIGHWNTSPNLSSSIDVLTNRVKPVAKFDNGISNNYIKIMLKATQNNLDNLTEEITQLNSEKTTLEKEVGYYEALQSNLSVFTDFNDSYITYKNLLSETISFYSLKNSLVNIAKKISDELAQINTAVNTYLRKEDGSIDPKINNLYNVLTNRISILNTLCILCSELGTDNSIITQIKTITPERLLLRQISYDGDLPERDCYYTINNLVNSYNYDVSNSYTICFNQLDNTTITEEGQIVQEVIDWLNNLSRDDRLDNLTKSYNGYRNECYRYTGLVKAIEGRVNSISEQQADTYSYNLVINNILQPIYNDLAWYISFTNNSGYTSIITDFNEKITELSKKINLLTVYKEIASEMYYYDRFTVSCCRPVVMTYNRYEMSFLNGWDGNKLQTTDGYIIAPQIGAGIKNSDNSFTGIVLGTKQVKENTTGQVGLFGYNYGIQTMFLNSRDGSASFGEAGAGQIILDPSTKKAIIKSGNYNDNNSTQIFQRVYPRNDSYWTYDNPSELGYWESVLNADSSAYIYVETTDTRPVVNKAYYKKTDAKGGMLIDLTTPEIKFGTGNFKVTKEGHITAKGGGEIAGWTINDTQMFKNNLYIDSGTTKTITVEGVEQTYTSYGFYTNKHDKIDSTTKGFYLGPDGLSINGEYTETSYPYNTIRSRFEINVAGNPKLFSGNHDALNATSRGFYLGQDGFSISNGSRSRFEISTEGDPKLFSSNHNSLNSQSDGFYLGNDGMSIGSKIYIDKTGLMRIGYKATTGDGSHYWTIDGSSYRSSISYGTPGESGSVYIGTDKIMLGENFSVDNQGILKAINAELSGKITANEGSIGGWIIVKNYDGTSSQLKSQDEKIKLNSGGGGKFIEGPNAYIDLEGGMGTDGTDFSGCHINAKNVCFSAEKIWTTRSRGATSLYEGQDYEISFWPNNEYQIRLKWINGLLVEHEVLHDG